jgi:outer membrane receptor protein involved in Fe transport
MGIKATVTLTAIAIASASMPASAIAQANATTATVRGTVTDQAGAPLGGIQVVVRNQSTGFQAGALTGETGRYIVAFLESGGPYLVSATSVGYRPLERTFPRLQIGEVLAVDFTMVEQAVQLEGLEVNVEGDLIEVRQSGVIDRVSQNEIENLPTNGRNFADFVALSSNSAPDVGDGSGGNLSLNGGRRGDTNIQIDGVENNGTFFGGEARGSDRIAFAFSQETVKEFQVITNGYDVEHGNFTGGLVNAVTKSGTNDWDGAAFYYRRGDSFTGKDFLGREPQEFASNQYGGYISGPIQRDRAHFLLSVDVQDRSNPIFPLFAPDVATGFEAGIHPDSLARLISILENVYGVQNAASEFERVSQTNDQIALFGRVDWRLNDDHTLTVRNNFTDLKDENDRISENEAVSNGGIFEDRGNSLALNLKSILSPTVFNDLRFQWATESRPRAAYSAIPQADINLNSEFSGDVCGGGTCTRFSNPEVFNDPVLPNSLDETTYQLVNNLIVQRGNHTLKFGTNNMLFDIDNFFFFNQFGDFDFDGLDNFEQGIPFRYEIAGPGLDGSPPRAIYNVLELAFYAQDDWQVNDRLTLNLGLRYDLRLFPDKAPTVQGVLDDFGLDTGEFPVDGDNVAPRVGFAYDVNGDGASVFRGGAGLFYGRVPSVFWSNALLNTGESQTFTRCTSGFDDPQTHQMVIEILRGERAPFASCNDIPGGSGFSFTPNVNAIGPDVEVPYALKANIGYDRLVAEDWRVGVDLQYSGTNDNFYNIDRNLGDERFRTDDGLRPVFQTIDLVGMELDGGSQRISSAYNDVLELVNDAESRTYQATFEVGKAFGDGYSVRGAYTYSNSRDNSSSSCCISSTAIGETPTASSPNFLGDPGDDEVGSWGPADFERPHQVVLSSVAELPWGGIIVSGIYRGQSGLSYTPTVDGDVNGDGRDTNDRAYIGEVGAMSFASPEDAATYQGLLNEHECLAEQVGRIAARNSCRNPWVNRLDARLTLPFETGRGQRIELIADLFNVLNLLNEDWGQVLQVGTLGQPLLEAEDFDILTNQFTYSVRGGFGEDGPFGFRPRQWQVQLGARVEY